MAIIFAVFISIAALFDYTDPFEAFHNYEIPANPNDVILCYWASPKTYFRAFKWLFYVSKMRFSGMPYYQFPFTELYMITNDGTVKKAGTKERNKIFLL